MASATHQDLGSLVEEVAAIANVATLAHLSIQIRASNPLASGEASRTPGSDVNAVSAFFETSPIFRAAAWRAVAGSARSELELDARTLPDYWMISITNILEQLAREIQ